MTNRLENYKCKICGNVVNVLHAGDGVLVCCGQMMSLLKENTVDATVEKHIPVLSKTENGFKVVVGEVTHPMEPKHYIEWIELNVGGKSSFKFLKPEEKPEAEFCVCKVEEGVQVFARAYCNLHSLWRSK